MSNESRPVRGLNLPLAGKAETASLGWGIPANVTREAELLGQVRRGPAHVLRVGRLDNGYYRVLIEKTNQVYRARSITDVVDSVASSLKHSPSPPPTSRLLAGFDDTGAINPCRSVELRLQGEGISKSSCLSTRLIADAATDTIFRPSLREGDLSRARFADWHVEDVLLPSGRAGKVFKTTIDVPPKVGGVRGLLLTIRVFFESLFPALTSMVGAQDSLLLSLSKLPADARLENAAARIARRGQL